MCTVSVQGMHLGESDVLGIAMSAWLRELNPSDSCGHGAGKGTQQQGHSVQLGVEQLSVVEGEN